MSEPLITTTPVMVTIPLEGCDSESRAISAAIYLLEKTQFDIGKTLTSDQRARIADYLCERFHRQVLEEIPLNDVEGLAAATVEWGKGRKQ